MTATANSQRELFETAVVERLKESGFLEIQIRTECLGRCDDGYQDEVVNAGWHYWQTALAAQTPQEVTIVQSGLAKAARDFLFLFIVDGGDRGISIDDIDPMEFSQKFANLETALSTDADPVIMDDEDRTPMPIGFDEAIWRKADEVHHAMALVARDQECVKIIYAALSTHNAEPVKTAPAVAVKALKSNKKMLKAFGADDIREGSRMCFETDGTDKWEDYYEVPFHVLDRIRSALSAQVQEERCRDCDGYNCDDGCAYPEAKSALAAQVQDVAGEPCTEKSTDLTIPEGYVLLPIEPTQAMIMAYNRAGDDLGLSAYPNARIAYDAMVKTAPSASLRNTRDRCGWKLVPKEPLPEQLQTAAFNLSAEYGPEFVLANEAFARDVYAELVAASPASKLGDLE